MPPVLTERRLILLIGAIQFVNVLDFVMVMPLGPDFAKALGIPTSQLGYIGGSYTAAAAVSGLIGAMFLDRFDRRRALALALVGLVIGTLAGGFATDFQTLLAARVVAGAFGGPATALSLAIITDGVPPERRGRAMGAVMGAFAVASVLGVPAGLELARLGGWRMPFFSVAALAAVVTFITISLLPPQTAHLSVGPSTGRLRDVVRRPVVMLSLSATAIGVIANFAIIPNLAAYLQFNRGFPRDQLGLLYMVGGVFSFATLRIAGYLSDRYRIPWVAAGGSVFFIAVLLLELVYEVPWMPTIVFFVGFMVSGSFRFVPLNALSSRVPDPAERARFMSAQSAVQHIASSAGAMMGAVLLTELPNGMLVGIDGLAWFAVATSILLIPILWLVDRMVRRRGAQ